MHGFKKLHFFSKKNIKNFPLITQFFMFPLEYFAVKSQEMAIPDSYKIQNFPGEHAPGPP
jgi:hypothetical protein